MDHQRSTRSGQLDELLSVLADPYCRIILFFFRDSTDVVASLDTLVSRIDRQGYESEPVELCLHHTKLPRLEAAGIIDYDARTETVRYRGHPKLKPLLDCIEDL